MPIQGHKNWKQLEQRGLDHSKRRSQPEEDEIRLNLPDHLKIHLVILMTYFIPYVDQSRDIARPVPARAALVISLEGDEQVGEKILAERRDRKGYWSLTLMKRDTLKDTV